MKRLTPLILGAACAMATSAFAQSMGPNDVNGDGRLDKEEYIASAKANAERTDADKDGKITLTEMGLSDVTRALIATHGPDYGAVTVASVIASHPAHFAKLDADKDGFVTRDELIASRDAVLKPRPAP